MSWAQRRKATYIFTIFFIFAIIFAIIIFNALNKAPTCNDGTQNQDEAGVDCGGPCTILCRAQYSDPVVVWGPRWAKVLSSGSYNFLTYIQNPNIGAGSFNVPYRLSIYDQNNILLYQKNGSTFVPPNNNFVIFEDSVNLNDKIPARAKFDFINGNIFWQKITSLESIITPASKNLINEDTRPKLMVTMKNSSLQPVSNIESVAILYDENNNAIAFSKTKIDIIPGDGSTDIVFTWPEKFTQPVVRIDIVSKVLPN